MKTQLTEAIKMIAKNKAETMPLGTFSRLSNPDGSISDIVISPALTGIYYYYVPDKIDKTIFNKLIEFNKY